LIDPRWQVQQLMARLSAGEVRHPRQLLVDLAVHRGHLARGNLRALRVAREVLGSWQCVHATLASTSPRTENS
jgi:hypothetical protein